MARIDSRGEGGSRKGKKKGKKKHPTKRVFDWISVYDAGWYWCTQQHYYKYPFPRWLGDWPKLFVADRKEALALAAEVLRLTPPRRKAVPTMNGIPLWALESPFGESYPWLLRFFGATSRQDGSKRERGRMYIELQNGAWRLCLKEPSLNLIGVITSHTFAGLFQAAEDALGSDSVDWRNDKYGPAKNNARVKGASLDLPE